jgi:hypothetical protein
LLFAAFRIDHLFGEQWRNWGRPWGKSPYITAKGHQITRLGELLPWNWEPGFAKLAA